MVIRRRKKSKNRNGRKLEKKESSKETRNRLKERNQK